MRVVLHVHFDTSPLLSSTAPVSAWLKLAKKPAEFGALPQFCAATSNKCTPAVSCTDVEV